MVTGLIKRHKPSRLFVKIFFFFFFSCVLFLCLFMISIGVFHSDNLISIREKIIVVSFSEAVKSLYESQGEKALQQYFKDLKAKKNLTVYLMFKDKKIIGVKPYTQSTRKASLAFQKGHFKRDFFLKDGFIFGPVLESNKLSGVTARLAVKKSKHLYRQAELEFIYAQFLFAILISAIGCYLLSLLITKPIVTLKKAMDKLALGDLNARVGSHLSNRHDELTDLGNNFDKMANELQSLIKSKERLLEDISHELRSPLARQKIAFHIMDKSCPEELMDSLRRAKKENRQLNVLIDEILTLAEINSQNRPLHLSTFNFAELITETINDANYELQESDIQYVGAENLTLTADKRLIRRALENLIRNSIKYTGAHKDIKVDCVIENESFRISVSDNGPGVLEEDLESIFEVFYRSSQHKEENKSGYGIGLAICKQIVELHQGEIWANNVSPTGFKVTFILPTNS